MQTDITEKEFIFGIGFNLYESGTNVARGYFRTISNSLQKTAFVTK